MSKNIQSKDAKSAESKALTNVFLDDSIFSGEENTCSSKEETWSSPPIDSDEWSAPREPATCLDIAAYILEKRGEISSMKLQKLVYYAQAWSLVWDEEPLFNEPVEAWANGPVVRRLFNHHRGQFKVSRIPAGNPDVLTSVQKETVDAILEFYGNMTAQELIDLSHSEKPWEDARVGIHLTARSKRVIRQDSMADYYSSL